MSDSPQSDEHIVEHVKRAENIQIVIATAIISSYIAVLGRDIIPANFFSELFLLSVLLSSGFLVMKMTALTTLVYQTEVTLTDDSSALDSSLSAIASLCGRLPDLESDGFSAVSQAIRWADRVLVPLFYILSLWLILIYIPFFAITKLAPPQLAMRVLQITSDPLFQKLFVVVSAPIVIIIAARFLLGYRATMAQIESGSVPGSLFVASGPSGSDTELLVKNTSESRVYETSEVRLRVERPSNVGVRISPAEELQDDVWKPKHDIPPGQRMIFSVNLRREDDIVPDDDEEVKISILLNGELEKTEIFHLDL